MDERLGMLVHSADELLDKLKGFLDGKEDVEDLYRGNIKRNKEALAILEADDEFGETVDKWFQRGKYSKLLGLWVKGLAVDWDRLHPGEKPKRVSLPTYPFARKRYWIPESAESPPHSAFRIPHSLHPLLHENTSDLSEQRFSSTFTGDEFFLSDHVVKGRKILPGVAYLEMARAAVSRAAVDLAAGERGDASGAILLKNVVWMRPVTVDDNSTRVHIGLFPGEDDEIGFEIYSRSTTDDAEPLVHGQGSAAPSAVREAPVLDIEAIQAECEQKIVTSDACYQAFAGIGVEYGPAHRAIETIYVGEGVALARLVLPDSVADTMDRFVLHPALMDSALQAISVLVNGTGAPEPALPFALEGLEVFGPCTPTMWAHVRCCDDDF
ncbi:MAG: type I polyketide synthase, partial [Desulfobacterales bacterium]|nr:type I polyketide synthase [Desulfobacterales bacterium]